MVKSCAEVIVCKLRLEELLEGRRLARTLGKRCECHMLLLFQIEDLGRRRNLHNKHHGMP